MNSVTVPWGIHTLIDLSGCDNERITSKEKIEVYIYGLVRILDMKEYGEPTIVHFGSGSAEGYTMVQLIETSLISGHFCNSTNEAYIDIFSCKEYDIENATNFTQEFFNAEYMEYQEIKRGCMFNESEDI